MNYRCETNLQEIEKYLRGAGVVAFDFETAPLPAYREDDKAALDAHRSHIVGVSLSVAEGSAIYVPLRHLRGPNTDPEQIIPFMPCLYLVHLFQPCPCVAQKHILHISCDSARVLPI